MQNNKKTAVGITPKSDKPEIRVSKKELGKETDRKVEKMTEKMTSLKKEDGKENER